ncbi:MAG: MgtC/SapB family protein [Clostridia bacterium]|nr:MgtC/SapB family protein [Clostridia bacterium]
MSTQEIIIRISISAVLGGLIGFQRELSRNSAGFRTHILVCLGACVAMITNEYLYFQFPDANIDVARMGSYVISGIGFLGAGSIIKDGFRVRGLTTAAGLWVVACLGVAVGAGFYWAALFGGLVVFMVLVLLKLMESKFISGRNRTEIELRIKNTPETMAEVMTDIGKAGVSVKDIDIQSTDKKWTEVIIYTTITNKLAMDRLKESLKKREDVKVISIEIVK